MQDFETIKLEIKNEVARLMLNRHEKHNAINALMIQELRYVTSMLSKADDVRVVVLAAEGKSFCAGGDLNWMKEQVSKDRAGKIKESSELALMLRELDELPKPLIGRVHAPAYGGGIGLISVCDISIATKACKFALTETRLGLIPATIGPYVVYRLGESNARQVFMNARVFSAKRANKLGLISKVVKASELDKAVESQVNSFLQCAPGAVADAKTLCRYLARSSNENQLQYTAEKLADRWETQEAQQGIIAFFNREKAPWIK